MLLKSDLPFEIDGAKIMPDFRNMVAATLLLQGGAPETFGGVLQLLGLLFCERPKDEDLAKAAGQFGWFYNCGRPPGEGAAGGGSDAAPVMDFDADAPLIYSAFRRVYGVNLAHVKFLHWWEFVAMLADLPGDVLLSRVTAWRGAKLADVPKGERDFVRRMKQKYALPRQKAGPRKTPGELAADMRAWADARFAEAQAALENRLPPNGAP